MGLALPLLARLAYEHPFDRWRLYAAASAGAVLTQTRVSGELTGETLRSESVFGMAGGFGAAFEAGPGSVISELGYLYALLDNDTVAGNVGGASICVGYQMELGPTRW